MKFSIITPSYNSEKTIRRTIESVLKQTYQDYEYIIIDGDSTDNTLEIIKQYGGIFGEKLKVISEKDNGIYDAMNKGIRLACGDLIGIINSDDWYELNTLENVVNDENIDGNCIYYGFLRFWEGGIEKSCALYRHEFLRETMINHPACFVAKKIYDEYGLYDCGYKAAADYEFMLRVFYKSDNVRFIPVYHILANFQIGGITGSYKSIAEAMKVKQKYKIISRWKYFLILIGLWGRKMLGE